MDVEFNPSKSTNFSNPVYDSLSDPNDDAMGQAIEFISSSPDHTPPGTLTKSFNGLETDRNSNNTPPSILPDDTNNVPAKPMVKSARGSYRPSYDSGRDTQTLVEIEEEDEY